VAWNNIQYQPTLTPGQKMNSQILLLLAAMGLLFFAGKYTETLACLAGQIWGLYNRQILGTLGPAFLCIELNMMELWLVKLILF
jgi:hypothetical protein